MAGVACSASAHPHGAMDCAVHLGLADGRLAWVDLQLTMDAASSQGLLTRVALQGDAAPPPGGRTFNQVLAGLFRQSGWMLTLQPAATSDAGPTSAAAPPAADQVPQGSQVAQLAQVPLDDPAEPVFSRDAHGRLVVQVRLVPPTPQPAAGPWWLACQDPTWYWLTGFTHPSQVSASGAACQADLGELDDAKRQALALQRAAQAAGAPGADQIALPLTDGTLARRTPHAALICR